MILKIHSVFVNGSNESAPVYPYTFHPNVVTFVDFKDRPCHNLPDQGGNTVGVPYLNHPPHKVPLTLSPHQNVPSIQQPANNRFDNLEIRETSWGYHRRLRSEQTYLHLEAILPQDIQMRPPEKKQAQHPQNPDPKKATTVQATTDNPNCKGEYNTRAYPLQ